MADNITLDDITLPKDLEWTDEFGWDKVSQSLGYSATGALFIQESAKQYGRMITLSGKQDMGWIDRATVMALEAKKIQPGLVMTLTLTDDRVFYVMFRQSEMAVDVASVLGYGELTTGALFKVNALRLMEVSNT